ncbi:alpha/beta fold hydrolase [uncultured Roseobacter sp.]|uniref:alpha/beta hydrolase n=1 Tax=uncultured Roseobacter sp. TaxID=114847 RepID=UPI002617F7D5|nr:alpha/beta fold hydrolase [uncultured Roseobacter sp.]
MLRAFLAIAAILTSLWVLESARQDVDISRFDIGQTPVTEFSIAESDGPVVVIAHGFAGSAQMMQGYALPLARAGYRVVVFEFLGHGRHPDPMSGDVNAIDGTTRVLVEQTQEIIDAVTPGDHPVALVGHSMATDILVRTATTRQDIGPIVLISAFSQVIDAQNPQNLLLVTGAWEPGLRGFAQEALQMVAPDAAEGETVTTGDVTRRAIAAPFAEHVSVLQSRAGRREALAWLDRAYDRRSDVGILPTGWAILGLLCGLVLLFVSLAKHLPARVFPTPELSRTRFSILVLLPMVLTPLIAVPMNPEFLPVLVADYLVLHLMIFGAVQLALLWMWGVRAGGLCITAFVVLLFFCVLFGVALDRYAANFWPTPERLAIIAAMLLGAVPYMLADAMLTTNATRLRRLGLRMGLLISLFGAVTLDFDSLFFLVMIAPVLVLFYLVFGTMGRSAATRSGPLASGLALGIVLAWALGVSFPLFQV